MCIYTCINISDVYTQINEYNDYDDEFILYALKKIWGLTYFIQILFEKQFSINRTNNYLIGIKNYRNLT